MAKKKKGKMEAHVINKKEKYQKAQKVGNYIYGFWSTRLFRKGQVSLC